MIDAMSSNGSSISGSVKMPMGWMSTFSSSSHSSMCDEATRISRGPFRVPLTYDVVLSRRDRKNHRLRFVERDLTRERAAEAQRIDVVCTGAAP